MSHEAYFEALSQVYQDTEDLTLDQFVDWQSNNELHDRMPFSKKVSRWLMDKHELTLDKPAVMSRAVSKSPVSDLNLVPITELINTIQEVAIAGHQEKLE